MDHDVYDGDGHDGAGASGVYNGMAATRLDGVAWQKSRHSNSQGSCVEFAPLPGGEDAQFFWIMGMLAVTTAGMVVYFRTRDWM